MAGHRRILGSCQRLWVRHNWNLNMVSESSDKSFCVQWWVDKLTIITEKWDFWVITDRSMKMWGQCSSSQENKCNSRNYYERNGKQNRKPHYAFFVEIHDTCTSEYCAQFLLVKTQQRSGGFPEVKGTPGQWRALPGASSSYGRQRGGLGIARATVTIPMPIKSILRRTRDQDHSKQNMRCQAGPDVAVCTVVGAGRICEKSSSSKEEHSTGRVPGTILWPSTCVKGTHPTWASRQNGEYSSKSKVCSSGWGFCTIYPSSGLCVHPDRAAEGTGCSADLRLWQLPRSFSWGNARWHTWLQKMCPGERPSAAGGCSVGGNEEDV